MYEFQLVSTILKKLILISLFFVSHPLISAQGALCVREGADSAVWQMLPEGTHSLLVQPVPGDPISTTNETTKKIGGFILLASCMILAYSDTDSLDSAVADKFKGKSSCVDLTVGRSLLLLCLNYNATEVLN
ncbi:hypothetical protein MKW98_029123 [Papaver atlanticum]|uniref:Uncharacterized protein n=1 Tax=Papaver atlanticum TaxID=357466 RepID=A0AAD4XBE0_9MAGN|nr:hypothetical protein MKW98_029123 [Papaver atlanticum]